MVRYIEKKSFWVFLFFISLLYLKTLSRTVFGGDSGDFLSAILTKSFAHPPGYPFYIILGILFSKLFYFLDYVSRISLISFFSTILTFFVLYKLFLEIEKKPSFNEVFLFLLSLLIVGINYIIWLYSVVPEVFSLNALISISIYYFAIKIYKQRKIHKKHLFILSLLIGLGISHHHTFVLVLPSVVYILIMSKKKLIHLKLKDYLSAGFGFLIGILPLLYLPLASYFRSEVNWGDATGLKGFLDVLLRRGYGTFLAGPFITQNPYHRLLQLKNLFIYLASDFTFPIVFIILLGIIHLLKKNSTFSNSLLIALFFFGPFFFFYANFPLSSPFMFATLERFLFLFYIFLVFPIYFGAKEVTSFIYKLKFSSTLFKRILLLYIYIVFLGVVLVLGFRNYQSIKYLRIDKTAEEFANEVLKITPPNSIILLSNDTVLFNTQFVYFYNKYFRKNPLENRIVIHASKLNFPFYYQILKLHYPRLKLPSKPDTTEFIYKNYKYFPIYSNTQIKMKDSKFKWRSYGLLFKLVYKDSEDDNYFQELETIWKKSISSKLIKEKNQKPLKFKNLFTYDILKYYAIAHQNTAYVYLKKNQLEKAYKHITAAKQLYPEDSDADYLLAFYYKRNNCDKAFYILKEVLSYRKDPLYFSLIEKLSSCVSRKNKKELQKLLQDFRDLKLSDL